MLVHLFLSSMIETHIKFKIKLFRGSRDRGYRGTLHSERHMHELLRFKKIQDLWDSEESSEEIAA